MKKIFTLLWLTITAFAFKAAAQPGTTCNAEYGYQYLSWNTVKFNPQLTEGAPLVTHTWTFGDGSPASNQVSPTHVFAASGNYPVVHTVIRVNPNNTVVCTQSFTKVVTIMQCNLVVDFNWTSTTANPLVIAFQNLSVPLSNTDSVFWHFGDNTTSNAVNPVHTYAAPGTYNVCLTVKKFPTPTSGQCIKTICKTIVIPPPCNLVVNFNWTTITANSLVINFHNLSVPLANSDSITWTFGDGTSSNAVHPVHTYAQPGTYTVCLRVKKLTPPGMPPCVREICKTLVIPPPCNLVANFTSQPVPNQPLSIKFTNTSTPIHPSDSLRWTFGDGTSLTGVQSNPNVASPTHTYTHAGTYTVCLRVKKNNNTTSNSCVREICRTIVIPPPCNLVVDFNWTVTPNNPLRIEFHNLTTPIAATDSIRWTFGDGTSSNQIHPVHTYTAPGTYTVCLRIIRYNGSNIPCIREICKTIVIPVPCNLVVNFTSQPVPNQPLSIKFTNTSTPIHPSDSLRWTFGDGTSLSGVQSNPNVAAPIHHYANAGTYTVCLRVKKNNLTTPVQCIREFCRTVVVTPPCNIVPNFTWTVTPTNPLRIEFHNTSTNTALTDSIRWTFGDGTSSNQYNPVHTYAAPGTYTVCLKIIRYYSNNTTPCIREICKTIVVTQPCNLVVNFSSEPVPTSPLTFKFHNLSTPVIATDSLFWTFGDGTTLRGVQGNPAVANPIHTYTSPGTYTVCLTVKKHPTTTNTPCIRTLCRTIVVPVPCNLVVNFSSAPLPTNPLSIKFTNLSTPVIATDSLFWTFGDGTTLRGVQGNPAVANPIHTYTAPGSYNVCLTVKKHPTTTNAPCIRTFCKTIVIPVPCNLVVNFTSQPDPNHPLRIKFTNTSTPIHPSDSVRWTFGDGSSVSGLQSDPNVANPTHNYATAGTYTVCLRIKKNNTINTPPGAICVREKCNTIVLPVPCNLVVNFTSQPDPNHPLRIKFTNTSTPIHPSDSVRWTFGDGSSVSGLQSDPNVANPTHNYATAGTYTVCLRIKKNNTINTPPTAICVREKCNTIVIPVPCNLVVNFTSQPDPNHPLRIKFTNTSTPISPSDSVRWTFGDGTSVSGLQSDPNVANPTHNYANAGTYTVCLRVKKNNNSTPAGTCVREKCATIVVHPPCNFYVNFSWRVDSVNPRKILFTNLSTPPTAAAHAVWTFGDGTGANTWNAVHEYAQPGRYRVCLRVYLGTTSNCFREICDTVYVPHPVPPCNQLSKFRFERFPNDNQKYKFIPDYINQNLQYTWTFGDGTGSQNIIAEHRYAQPGIYTACLTVWRGPNCASTTCHQINVQPQIICDTAHAWYTYLRSTTVSNRISFFAQGTMPIIDQTWTITRVGSTLPPVILHQNNPVYTFPDTGYYRVCLRAVLLGGCVKEYCNYIRILQVTNACTLQAFPNPATAIVNVNIHLTQPEMIHALVYNSQNVLVLTKDQQGVTGNNLVSLLIHNLPAGQYTIKLIHGNSICYAAFSKM